MSEHQDPASQGLVIVFTGNGKGKTSAAMGVLARASGRDLSVGVIQFIKSAQRSYGEAVTARKLGIPFQSLGDGFVFDNVGQADSRAQGLAAWQQAREWITSRNYDVLILDEITYLFSFGWLDVQEAITWIQENKPAALHLILTGRYAPKALIDYADLVTEMQEIKHPYSQRRLPAQAGIDF